MADLVLGQANSLTNPQIVFGWQSPNVSDPAGNTLQGGFFQPLDSVSFRVLREDGTVYVGPTVVDPTDPAYQLDAADTDNAGRLIVLPFTVAAPEDPGTYTVEVTFVAHPPSGALAEQVVSWPFRVLDPAQGYLDRSYAQLQDMLDQGFPVGNPAPVGGYSFVQARRALLRASRFIEEITGRFFTPRYTAYDFDGRGGSILQVEHPIVGLTHVGFTFSTWRPADLPIQEGDLRVYNRHIRQNLTNPDDRQDPRVEFLRVAESSYRDLVYSSADLLSSNIGFAESQQNLKLIGVWGYTDYDGSPFGKTPDLLVELTLRLAARYIEPLWVALGGAGSAAMASGPIASERTLDQSVTFANFTSSVGAGAYFGAFTGDPEIDNLLVLFMAPPLMRSV